jgi:hypothetical protein
MLKRIADVEGVLIAGMTAITAFMFAVAFTYPRLASEFPKLILGITLVMLLYLLFGRLTGRIPPSKIKGAGKLGPSWWLLSISLFAYYAIMGVLGFLPTTALFVAGLQLWVNGDVKKWPRALLYGLGTAVAFWAVMTFVMQVPIPAGMLPFFK